MMSMAAVKALWQLVGSADVLGEDGPRAARADRVRTLRGLTDQGSFLTEAGAVASCATLAALPCLST